MLFDLRGRGRRRTIQVIYASLALLMGGGLVFFGIGGNTSGGLFDAFSGNSGGGSAQDIFQERVDRLEKRVETSPRDASAWAELARLRVQTASTGENYDQATQQFTDKGREELQRAADAWRRYLALDPPRPDPNVARLMVQAYGLGGLQQYEQAVQAMEIVLEDTDQETAALYAQLAVLAHGAGQDRKSTLAADRAKELAPKDQRTQIEQGIQAGRQQIDQAKGAAAGATAGGS
jgi:tetratricopeptide (TPR) repeat protein